MGKGDKNRTTDMRAFREHFAQIKWPHYCKRCGKKVCMGEDFCPKCKRMVD